MGYDGIFVTNHFMDTSENLKDPDIYRKYVNFFFSDFEEGLKHSKEIDIKVFAGVEVSYEGTDFLIYGLDKEWYLNNPQVVGMTMSKMLSFMMENGALIIQAHPFREDFYIDHIRLFPRHVHGVEIINGRRSESENKMAQVYTQNYDLRRFAGSDNHKVSEQEILAGVCFDSPIIDEKDFVNRVKSNEMRIFSNYNTFYKTEIS